MLSGWNCNPTTGIVLCLIAIISSPTVAVTSRQSGTVLGTIERLWYLATCKGFGNPLNIPLHCGQPLMTYRGKVPLHYLQ